jgi:hypothetical protein
MKVKIWIFEAKTNNNDNNKQIPKQLPKRHPKHRRKHFRWRNDATNVASNRTKHDTRDRSNCQLETHPMASMHLQFVCTTVVNMKVLTVMIVVLLCDRDFT